MSINKNYTTISEDKFNNVKTTTWNAWSYKPDLSAKINAQAELGIIWYLGALPSLGVDEGLGMGMRKIDKDGVSLFTIEYEYHRYDWMHLKNGDLKIVLDSGEVLQLYPKEIRTHVYSTSKRGGKIFEKGYWILDIEDFKKICDSSKVEVRVTGSDFFIEFEESHNQSFLFMLRSMYNESVDSNCYIEALNEKSQKEKEESESSKKFGKGCLIFIVIVFLIVLLIANM